VSCIVFVRKDFKRHKKKKKYIVYDGYVKLNFIVVWRNEQGQVPCFRPVDIFVSWAS
jgi:hypothetical protein